MKDQNTKKELKQPTHQAKGEGQEKRIPLQVKADPETRKKMKELAASSGLSLNDVANLMLSAGLPIVRTKLAELKSAA